MSFGESDEEIAEEDAPEVEGEEEGEEDPAVELGEAEEGEETETP